MDAPGHFVEGGAPGRRSSTPRELVLPIVVIDISKRAASDPDAEVTVDDLRAFERRHGRIPRGALVAMNSGWAPSSARRRTRAARSATTTSRASATTRSTYMIAAQARSAIAVDTLSLDTGNSATFPVHSKWLAEDHFGLENLANLDKLPPHGAIATVGVIPWEEGSGGPARVLATY